MLSKDCCMLIDYEMAMGKRSGMRFFTLPDFTLSDQPIRPGKPELSGHFFRHGIFQEGVQLVAGHKLPQRTLCQKIGQTLYVRQANNAAVSFDRLPVSAKHAPGKCLGYCVQERRILRGDEYLQAVSQSGVLNLPHKEACAAWVNAAVCVLYRTKSS